MMTDDVDLGGELPLRAVGMMGPDGRSHVWTDCRWLISRLGVTMSDGLDLMGAAGVTLTVPLKDAATLMVRMSVACARAVASEILREAAEVEEFGEAACDKLAHDAGREIVLRALGEEQNGRTCQ